MSNGPEPAGGNLPFTVALTGGIAAGKTLVSDEFARLGVPVIDTDVIARELVEPGRPALHEIEKVFGAKVIDRSGRMDRQAMRSMIFSDPEKRSKLEAILHPRIRREAGNAVARVTSPYCILVIPLLAERETYPFIDRVLVVDVDTGTQVRRLMARDKSTRRQAELALASQPSRELRLRIADDVLNNTGPAEQTRQAVARLHLKYSKLASGK